MAMIKLTQYLHPSGRTRSVGVEVPDDVAAMATDLVLSCEMMPNDSSIVVIYCHHVDDDIDENPEAELCFFATNGPGEDSPQKVVENIIRAAMEEK